MARSKSSLQLWSGTGLQQSQSRMIVSTQAMNSIPGISSAQMMQSLELPLTGGAALVVVPACCSRQGQGQGRGQGHSRKAHRQAVCPASEVESAGQASTHRRCSTLSRRKRWCGTWSRLLPGSSTPLPRPWGTGLWAGSTAQGSRCIDSGQIRVGRSCQCQPALCKYTGAAPAQAGLTFARRAAAVEVVVLLCGQLSGGGGRRAFA